MKKSSYVTFLADQSYLWTSNNCSPCQNEPLRDDQFRDSPLKKCSEKNGKNHGKISGFRKIRELDKIKIFKKNFAFFSQIFMSIMKIGLRKCNFFGVKEFFNEFGYKKWV